MTNTYSAAAEQGCPAMLSNLIGDAGLLHPVNAGDIHDLQVAAVIHVAKHIDVMRHDAEAGSRDVLMVCDTAAPVTQPYQQQS